MRLSLRPIGRLLLLACAAALLVLAVAPAALAKPKATKRAERAVKAKLAGKGVKKARVSCRRRGSKRWSCSWALSRQGTPSCRGTLRVAQRGRRLRVSFGSTRCSTQSSRMPVRMPVPVKAPALEAPAKASAPTTASKPSSPAPAKPALMFGFNDFSVRARWATAQQSAQLNHGAGTTVSRVGVDWRWAEPWRGHLDLGDYDAQYRELTARGIRPMWMPAFSPNWAADSDRPCDAGTAGCHLPPARSEVAAYAKFAAELAKRYPKAAGIEVWNEPNQNVFWKTGPNPERYAELLKATYKAVKAANPDMPVISGGLADNGNWAAGIPPKPYAQRMLAAGTKGSFDGFGIHPYPHAPGLWDTTFSEMRQAKAAVGDAKPFWITETGWTTTGRNNSGWWPQSWILSEADQGPELVKLIRKAEGMSDVRALMIHTLIEAPGDASSNPGVGYGVLHNDRTPKPAYCAIARARGKSTCG